VEQERLGLFDTPPNRREIQAGFAVVAVLLAAFLLILPFRETRAGEIAPFVPVVDAVMCTCDLIIAVLLYAQATVYRSHALTVLASGYVFCALVIIPHALTLPGAFAPDGLLGAGVNTTAYLAMFYRAAFPLSAILYVLFAREEDRRKAREMRRSANASGGLSIAILLATGAMMLAIRGSDSLPTLFLDRSNANYFTLFAPNSASFVIALAAAVLLLRRRKSVLDLWLLVALSAWLIQTLLNLSLRARFTIGWYGLFLMLLTSSLIMMLALLAESNRLYARLALATAARNREREGRLASMDAMAAAISHEVGQPLAAVTLNASAGLRWLTLPEPQPEKAIESLHAINDSGHQSFNIIKKLRAGVANGADYSAEFNLNQLVLETLESHDRELSAAKVSLAISLDEGLPNIIGNRAQIEQVLLNLVGNAIESVTPINGKRRRISIRSRPLDDSKVLLEVSHSGTAIAAEDVRHIFDAFHLSNTPGSGMGLSLCRTIVEQHGGRIWASPGRRSGAIFHVQLPRDCQPTL
jgi:signal transduction histidine kinase